MPWADLTITRENIDAFEGQTFLNLDVTGPNSDLGIGEQDSRTLSKAKNMLTTDTAEEVRHLVVEGAYASEDAVLDALYDADDEGLLEDLLTYKFLEKWFWQDAPHEESKAYASSIRYNKMYNAYIGASIRRLLGLLTKPKQGKALKWVPYRG